MDSKDLKLNQIIEEKNKVNELTKNGNFIQAEKGYLDIIEKINKISKEDLNNDILNQKKLVFSNLCLVLNKQNKSKEAKKYDLEIINKIDKKFSKSYARLINTYLNENNITMARYYYSLMKANCSNDEINKFPEIIIKVDKEIKKKDSLLFQNIN